MQKQTQFQYLRDEWHRMSIYQRFESVVTLILTAIIGLVIVVSLYKLGGEVVSGLFLGALNPTDHNAFQAIFAEVLTVMIALEFNHTLQFVVPRQQSIIQTKVVLLISLLALARKVIVLDLDRTPPAELAGLAALILALGGVYWLMRERDDRQVANSKTAG
ncbi:MAG TPA: phosphate-starvation-inducible PsiE family protein [Usitatibacter sp.]|nr:phosphate-starvation-inducible PsiE family protein [Usitatibacter sp.]